MKYEASIRKVYQLSREIEQRDTYANMQHSVWKLMSFLADEVPGWREEAQIVQGADLLREASD